MIIDTGNYRIDLNSLASTVITDTYRGIYSRLDRTCGCDAAVWAISYAVNYDSLCGKLDLGMRYFAESSHGFFGGEKSVAKVVSDILEASEIKKRIREIRSAVKCAMRSLPAAERKMLFYLIKGKSVNKIGSLFGKSRRVTLKTLDKALLKLGKYLSVIGVDDGFIADSNHLLSGKTL